MSVLGRERTSTEQFESTCSRQSASTVLAVLVASLPILYQFNSPLSFLSLGELLLIPAVVFYLVKDFGKIVLDRNLALFYLIPIGLTFIAYLIPNNYFDIMAFGRLTARITLYYFLIIICARRIDIRFFLKVYTCIAGAMCALLLLQCFFHYCTSVELPVMRSFCEILYEYPGSKSLTGKEYYQTFGFRPAALFTEPSYFAFYIIPLVILLLFVSEKQSPFVAWIAKKRVPIALFLTVVSLLSSSSASLFIFALIWGLYLIGLLKKNQTKKNSLRGFIILAAALMVALVLYSLGLFDVLIDRTMKGASFEHRVLRGLVIFETLDPLHQIFGVGLNNHAAYIETNNIITAFDESTVRFSAIADIANRLITSGIIGFVALIWFVVVLFHSSRSKVEKVLVVVLALNFCFNWWQYSFRFAFMMILIYLVRDWMKCKKAESE